jgi:hypothetical protein
MVVGGGADRIRLGYHVEGMRERPGAANECRGDRKKIRTTSGRAERSVQLFCQVRLQIIYHGYDEWL